MLSAVCSLMVMWMRYNFETDHYALTEQFKYVSDHPLIMFGQGLSTLLIKYIKLNSSDKELVYVI